MLRAIHKAPKTIITALFVIPGTTGLRVLETLLSSGGNASGNNVDQVFNPSNFARVDNPPFNKY